MIKYPIIAERFQQIIRETKLSQRELFLVAPRISSYVRGMAIPTQKVAKRLSVVTGYNADWMVGNDAPAKEMPK